MVEHIAATYALGREDAYLLCSLAVDLKISEIVEAGQYIVSPLLPGGDLRADLSAAQLAGTALEGRRPGLTACSVYV
jgi:acetamidase/formamidase